MSDWPIKETRSGRMTDAERYQCVLDDILRDIGKVAARLAYGTPRHPGRSRGGRGEAGRTEGRVEARDRRGFLKRALEAQPKEEGSNE